jgi:hypothetical protein
MIDFLEVSERIRSVIKTKMKKEKIYDRDIAKALNLEPQYYAVIKKRKKIPYEAIAAFCYAHKISMNWILLSQYPKSFT